MRLAKEARREAVIMGCDTLIVDTGRPPPHRPGLMAEMESLKSSSARRRFSSSLTP